MRAIEPQRLEEGTDSNRRPLADCDLSEPSAMVLTGCMDSFTIIPLTALEFAEFRHGMTAVAALALLLAVPLYWLIK